MSAMSVVQAQPTLFQHLLSEGIPSTLLIDLLDPEGMKAALTSELLVSDVQLAPPPAFEVQRTIRSA